MSWEVEVNKWDVAFEGLRGQRMPPESKVFDGIREQMLKEGTGSNCYTYFGTPSLEGLEMEWK